MRGFFEYVKRNPMLGVGLGILITLILFTLVGRMFIDPEAAYKQTTNINRPPSAEYPFGAIAGAIGLGVGIVLGFISGYVGGVIDTIITSVIDVYLTIPSFLILVLIATTFKNITLGVVEKG